MSHATANHDSFSSILVNRLILNLRRVAKSNNEPTSMSTTIAEPQFAANPFIGNIGAPLRVDSFDVTDDGIEWGTNRTSCDIEMEERNSNE